MEQTPKQTAKPKPHTEVRDLQPDKDPKAGGGKPVSGGQTSKSDGIANGDGG